MRRIAGAPVSRETQEHVAQAETPVEAGQVRTALAEQKLWYSLG